MTIPFVEIKKEDGSLGVTTQQNPTGILAIIGPRIGPSGPSTPFLGTKKTSILNSLGYTLLAEDAAYTIGKTGKPVLIVPVAASTEGDYGDITYVGTGSLDGSITGSGGSPPSIDLHVTVRFIDAGTTGTNGITYQTSIDSRDIDDPAKVWSALTKLGTNLTIAIANTGVLFDLVTGKTVVADDYFVCDVTGPVLSDADALVGLDMLAASKMPWECVAIDGLDASSTTVSNADTTLDDLEDRGKYRMFTTGARMRAQDGTETETQYLAAMTTQWGSVASIRGCVTADGEFFTSPLYGVDVTRKALIPYSARLMSIDVTVDAAQVADGPLGGVRLVDENGNLVYHDEDNDPGLDAIRLVTLRSIANKIGTFVTNPLVISTPGSDWVLAQQVRTMNRACEIGHGTLTNELSRGFFVDNETGFIREDSARSFEAPTNAAIREEIGKKVQDVAFTLSRDDVITPPTTILTGEVDLVMPVYVKGFRVAARLKKTISVQA